MYRKFTLLIAVLMLLPIASCAPDDTAPFDPTDIITIDDFVNDDGEYVFRDSRWGMTKTEVEDSLGITLGEENTLRGGSIKVGLFEEINSFDILAREKELCSRGIQFNDDKFAAITYEIFGEHEDMQRFYEENVGKFTEKLGEPFDVNELSWNMVSEISGVKVNIPSSKIRKGQDTRWTHPYGDGEYLIMLAFSYDDEGKASFIVGAGILTAAQIARREGVKLPQPER